MFLIPHEIACVTHEIQKSYKSLQIIFRKIIQILRNINFGLLVLFYTTIDPCAEYLKHY